MSELCQFVPIQYSEQLPYRRCVNCGYLLGPPPPGQTIDFLVESFQRPCPTPNRRQAEPLPNNLIRFKNYAEAYARHIASGMQLASEADLVWRFRCCSSCEHYSDLEGACSICGCYVSLDSSGRTGNKLLWAIEACPDRPSKWPAKQ